MSLTNERLLPVEGSNPAFENPESVEFAGKAVAHLAADPNYFSKTGRILFTCDLAKVRKIFKVKFSFVSFLIFPLLGIWICRRGRRPS